MYALVDCNSFYASCEQVFNPKLRNRPVVVLSNNDGCVIARSKEAKRIGIKMGEPAFKIAALIQSENVAVYSANFALYGDISRRVMETLRRFSPHVEIYSIDEAFLSFDGFNVSNLAAYGKEISNCVAKWTGVKVGVGIAPTKTLAKVANHIAKKNDEYNGVCALVSPDEIQSILKTFPIKDVWGVGRQYAAFLEKHKVFTAAQFCELSPDFVKKHLTIVGLRTQKELQGVPCLTLETTISPKKSILTSRSFGSEITEYRDLKQAVATFAGRCAEKLRRQNSLATYVSVFVLTNPFKSDVIQYHAGNEITLSPATNLSCEIIKSAIVVLKNIYRPGLAYKKAGVLLSGFTQNAGQADLFNFTDREKLKRINRIIDEINSKMGRGTVRLGVEGFRPTKWKMRQNRLSQRFTTNWNELLEVE